MRRTVTFAAALVLGSVLSACQEAPKVRECTLGVGTCECPPGDPQCGPKALIYSDGYRSAGVQLGSDAVGAIAALRGSSYGAGATSDFVAAYNTSGALDVLVIDVSNNFNPSPWITYDWVNCGGRLIYNNWGYTAWERALLQVDTSAGFSPAREAYADPASPAALFAGIPSPLTVTAATLPWGSFGVEVTPNPVGAGFVAARYTSASGTNAIAVTRNNRVVVNGFLPSDHQAVDNNGNGIPDMQELYKNEILYLMQQAPDGLTCSLLGGFEYGPWPQAPWTAKGATYGSITAGVSGCEHDGLGGFDDGGNAGINWYARTDVTVGSPGQKLSMWFKTPAVAASGNVLLGFGSTGVRTWSLHAQVFNSALQFATNTTYGGGVSTIVSAAQAYALSTWFRLEVEFGTPGVSGTPVTGRLYSSDGVTVLNTLNTTISGFTPGGVSFLSLDNAGGSACLDTIKVY